MQVEGEEAIQLVEAITTWAAHLRPPPLCRLTCEVDMRGRRPLDLMAAREEHMR